VQGDAVAGSGEPGGDGFGVDISSPPKLMEIGKGEIIKQGSDVAILAYGSMVYPSVDAAEQLSRNGIHPTVVNARFVKPLDEELIISLAREHRLIVTVEEAYLAGGFGSAVMELLEARGLQDSVKVVRMGVPDEIVTHGDPKRLLGDYGLNAEGISSKVSETLAGMDNSKHGNRRIRAVK